MKKNILFLAAGILILVIFVGLRKNSAPFFSVTEYQCIQDGALSDEYCSTINGTLSELLKNNCAAHVIIDQLKNQFSALKKIVISYQPAATRVKILAHEPKCCVNNSVVLTAHDELFDKNVFAEDAVADVPKIVCNSSLSLSSCAHSELVEELSARGNPSTGSGRALGDLVSSLLQQLPQGIDKIYNIELMNKYCVHLVDKEQPHFTIISSIAQKKSPQLLAQCATIKKNIDERKGFEKGVCWVADTRFAHYIVAYKA